MSKEQKQLLYEIAKWHDKDFYNRMDDHWTTANYQIDTECAEAIKKLEEEYINTYGELPEWKYIDDVWAAIKTLEKELASMIADKEELVECDGRCLNCEHYDTSDCPDRK
jgi:hypothetical protein